MKTMKTRMAFLVLAAPLSGTAQATLQGRDRDGNLATSKAFFDPHLNNTRLANANVNDALTWAAANAWTALQDRGGGLGPTQEAIKTPN